ncbi:MAG TPA: 2-phospho-L-lactate transferase [Actinomycetota bacterium]|nr:2-phospho-L-lactate transferase [Actinomycetota bacterium]
MRIVALAGGVGSARLLSGLVRVVAPSDLAVVVNTGDDESVRGLHLSPDIDTVLYHLAAIQDWERGWGIGGDTFSGQERYAGLASRLQGVDAQEWLALGDRDLATKMLRTRLLDTGMSLSEATDALRRSMGLDTTVIPMSDDRVRTVVGGYAFQEWFVRLRQEPPVGEVRYEGAAQASPAPGVVEAVEAADLVLLPPSNPILSLGPMLAMGPLRSALEGARGVRVAVSPIVGGRALKGPADRLMASLGHEVSPVGVARIYAGLVDVFVLDERDAQTAPAVAALGMRPVVCDTVMRSPEDAARLAKTVVADASS